MGIINLGSLIIYFVSLLTCTTNNKETTNTVNSAFHRIGSLGRWMNKKLSVLRISLCFLSCAQLYAFSPFSYIT